MDDALSSRLARATEVLEELMTQDRDRRRKAMEEMQEGFKMIPGFGSARSTRESDGSADSLAAARAKMLEGLTQSHEETQSQLERLKAEAEESTRLEREYREAVLHELREQTVLLREIAAKLG